MNTPGAGSYEFKSKVGYQSFGGLNGPIFAVNAAFQLTVTFPLCRSLRVRARPWVRNLKSRIQEANLAQDLAATLSTNKRRQT